MGAGRQSILYSDPGPKCPALNSGHDAGKMVMREPRKKRQKKKERGRKRRYHKGKGMEAGGSGKIGLDDGK